MSTIHSDLATLQPHRTPNNWFVAPPDSVAAEPDQPAPLFDAPADRVAEAWLAVIERQPLAAILGVSSDGLQIEAEQRSAVFGFIDRISTKFLPVASGRSTAIAYSRALVGYWDFGVNRRGLRRWLSELASDLERSAQRSAQRLARQE
jgi:uncharacterized protein (DUF1499 family)